VSFSNVPDITDIEHMATLLTNAGARVLRDGDGVVVHPEGISNGVFDTDTAHKLRASIILTGPLLSRLQTISFPSPGGCVIGKRPIDLFLDGYTQMGAHVEDANGESFTISTEKGLSGAEIFFKLQSVTATETLLMSAVLAHGTTILKNVALEPEVTELAHFLKSCGAQIEGIGTMTLTIKGTGGELLSYTASEPYRVIPDRIEAGSYMVLGALCAENLEITNCNPAHLELPIRILQSCGVPIEITDSTIRIVNNTKENKEFICSSLRTHEYPGFPTDLQAPFTVFFTQTTGESIVEEMIFEGRLGYTKDLVYMGAVIDVAHPHRAVVRGSSKLTGRELYTPDLRAGLAYIIAACVAKGTSRVHNVHFIDRGYEQCEQKLRSIGVSIERTTL
jgi:UDP-N-acetylglucosamine 1-carboxyvinyltransferase